MVGPPFALELGARALLTLASTRLAAPVRPDRLLGMAAAPLRAGLGPAALVAVNAARHPDRVALIDERGGLTWGELDRRGTPAAAGLRDDFGLGPGRSLAVQCRNHRGFVDALLAGSRCGADLLLLNTDFSAAQLTAVLARETPAVAIHDDEYSAAFDRAGYGGRRVVAWHDETPSAPTVEELVARDGRGPHSLSQGRYVLLTSGTTGPPKGARRSVSPLALIGPWTALVSTVPLRAREPWLIAPPFFHGFGFSHLALALALGATLVMRRRFDAAAVLDDLERHRVTTLAGVPVMHQRILRAYEGAGRHDLSALRVVLSGAAALPPSLSEALTDAFGDVVFNLYGSTESGFGAIAVPGDLRAAPGTVGRPPYGTRIKILDGAGRELPAGATGHLFVGGPLMFDDYSGGVATQVVDGLMNTGDLGHLDSEGRLFIDGRQDDMIVSGGENVFPGEVEDLLRRHEGVEDVAVVGVADEEFGQRLRAYVVTTDGAHVSEQALKRHVRDNLARFKVPRDVVFVDELPRNTTGKVLRARLG